MTAPETNDAAPLLNEEAPEEGRADDGNDMPKAFEPKDVEKRWYAFWLEHDLFAASDSPEDKRPVYCVPMPPPNVTGSLHMGHAMRVTFEDILTRWHRMRGFNTLWQPGIDHAGIATQTVVERQLKREGKTRHDLGRAQFLERVWAWKAESGGRIAMQQRELGASADWKRSKFTMDPDQSRAVREAFVRLYEEGLLFRSTRLVNWDVEAQTVLSDLEVIPEEGQNGEMYEFAYKIDGDEAGGEIVVATTRPETMLGDTAVAVHPDDPRYTHLHGKKLKHPFVDRLVPIITDAVLVDPKFGTGAVKVTPAHDWNDFATGKRHKLEEINLFTKDGRVNENGGQFKGLERGEARKAVKRELKVLGLDRGAKPHILTLPRSERSGTVVEPMISTQWFVKMETLAKPALDAVHEGRTQILPEEWVKTYDHFLENIQDWCISRQLWWGHQIPAWHCEKCGHCTVSREDAKACGKCGATEIRQDEDVLDTWFSSALWPFATLGWPEKTPALEKFYPASDLETGYDILFFWVARMMMMGIHFMGEPPFKRVLLAGLLVDENGDKMGKLKGNVIDPLDLIHGASFEDIANKTLPGAPLEESLAKFKKAYPSAATLGTGFPAFGTDALRLTLGSYAPSAKRIALAPRRIEGYRHFCNKMWNAVRFTKPYLDSVQPSEEPPPATLLANRWILAQLAQAVTEASLKLDEYRLDEATQALYRFFWTDLCDWFLELTKPIFAGSDEAAKKETAHVLAHALETVLRALHPFAPFVTEELWQRLPRPASRPVSVAVAPYPTAADGRADDVAVKEMAVIQATISAIRTVRSEFDVKWAISIPVVLRSGDEATRKLLAREIVSIQTLVKSAGTPSIGATGEARPAGHVLTVAGELEVLVGLKGLVDTEKELVRIERETKKVEKDVAIMTKKLGSPSFRDKAPAEVVAESEAQLAALQRTLGRLAEAREIAKELLASFGERSLTPDVRQLASEGAQRLLFLGLCAPRPLSFRWPCPSAR